MNSEDVIAATQRWLDSLVIELNLCPFAKRERINNRIRFAVSDASTEDELLHALQAEIIRLDDDAAIETTLLIHPAVLRDFHDYNAFLDHADALLVALDREGVYQVASFHPHYQFSDTDAEDAENFTNRSPYPMLHLLREDSLDRAIDSHPDVEAIPARNIELLNQMGGEKLRALREACFGIRRCSPENAE